MKWSQSTHDLGQVPTWRTEHDLKNLKDSVEYQRSMNQPDVDYVQHGSGPDKSLVALGIDDEHGHSHGGDHGHSHEEWPDPKTLEHPDERTDEGAYNWGYGRKWEPGMPIPAPILSSLPVRSRSRGRWDGDGM
jgi:hypothetical protein